MKPHYTDDRVTLYHGDCIEVMRTLPDASVDSVVTDPPYGLSFMGKDWDNGGKMLGQMATGDEQRGAFAYGGSHDRGYADNDTLGFQAFSYAWATEALRILKPGGHLLAFGGTRTWHRLAVAIEDAGFEVRDSIAWMYGSGFPKSHDVSKGIDKAAGVTFTESPAEGVGFMTPDGKDGYNVTKNRLTREGESTPAAQQWQGWGTALKPAFEPIVVARKPLIGTVAANVLTHGTGALNIDGCRIGTEVRTHNWAQRSAAFTQERSDTAAGLFAGNGEGTTAATGRWPANVILDESQAAALDKQSGHSRDGVAVNRNRSERKSSDINYVAGKVEPVDVTYGGEGGASRFFYVAKAGKKERPNVNGVAHPTVKPMALMQYLVRLVTPPGGTVLEPFAGSGTTIEAALNEGFNVIGIEMTDEYLPLIMSRIERYGDKLC
jgi:site-specific DNA-methyltransferase (adenine-specific)